MENLQNHLLCRIFPTRKNIFSAVRCKIELKISLKFPTPSSLPHPPNLPSVVHLQVAAKAMHVYTSFQPVQLLCSQTAIIY